MRDLHLVWSKPTSGGRARLRAYRTRALPTAERIIAEWLSSELDDPDEVYPELARRIAVALARRDAEIDRLGGRQPSRCTQALRVPVRSGNS